MYGIILDSLRQLVSEKYGEKFWIELKTSIECKVDEFQTLTVYPDSLVPQFVSVLAARVNLSEEKILFMMGTYFFDYLLKHGHDQTMRILGRNLKSFLDGLDNMHKYLRFTYPCLCPPMFFCANESRSGITLQYMSRRREFVHYVEGILASVARQFYQIELTTEIMSRTEEDGRIKVLYRLHFINTAHETVDDDLAVPSRVFFELFPFHLVVKRTMQISNVGNGFLKIQPNMIGTQLNNSFSLSCPLIDFTWEAIIFHRKNIFELILQDCSRQIRLHDGNSEGGLKVRGQMKYMHEWDCVVFLGTPILHSIDDMLNIGLFLNDLGLHDFSREMVFSGEYSKSDLEQAVMELKETKQELQENKIGLVKAKFQNLPPSIMLRILRGTPANQLSDSFDEVTLLAASYIGCPELCEVMSPADFVEVMRSMAALVDGPLVQHNCYKVCCSGCSFLLSAGCPIATPLHAGIMAELAFDMLDAIKNLNAGIRLLPNNIQLRIALHSGTVIGGVIENDQPKYVIFGKTVDIVKELEETGEAQRILLSEETKKKLDCLKIFTIKPKEISRDSMQPNTYWLEGRSTTITSRHVIRFNKEMESERERLTNLNSSMEKDANGDTSGEN